MSWLATPFKAVSSYSEMLDKIAWWTFAAALSLVILLASQVPVVSRLIGSLPQDVKFEGLPVSFAAVPIVAVLIAFGVAWLTRSIRWHDKLSDMFAVRRRFDVRHILLPLAAGCGAQLTTQQLRRLTSDRANLMEHVFYHYIKSNPPVLSEHSVGQAMDRWGNYWILAEAASLTSISAVILFISGSWLWSAVLLGLILLGLGTMHLVRLDCESLVQGQVAAILDSPGSHAALKQRFIAL